MFRHDLVSQMNSGKCSHDSETRRLSGSDALSRGGAWVERDIENDEMSSFRASHAIKNVINMPANLLLTLRTTHLTYLYTYTRYFEYVSALTLSVMVKCSVP